MVDKIINGIINNIDENLDNILTNISPRSIQIYLDIKTGYEKGNILKNKKLIKDFRYFYRLNMAGLSNNQKQRFFELLSEKEKNLEYILSELYKIKNRKEHNTI